MHVGSQQICLANQMIEIQRSELRNGQEFEVVVDFARFPVVERIRVIGILCHFLDNVVQETAPFRSRSQLRNEERVLMTTFVGCQDHATIFAPSYTVDVDGGLHRCPRCTISLFPNLNDTFVC